MNLYQQLKNKLQKEYEIFRTETLKLPAEDIYHKHYDICLYENMANFLNNNAGLLENIDEQKIQQLLTVDNLIEDFSFYFFHYCFTSSMTEDDLSNALYDYAEEI